MPFWTPKARLRWAFVALRDPRLKSTDKVVAVFCEGYVNPDGQFWVGKRTVARQLHISEKSVQRSLKNLSSFDYVRSKPRIGTTPIYTIQFPEVENDPGPGLIEQPSQDTIVPLTLYKPENKPSSNPSLLPVNTSSDPVLSNGLDKANTVTDIVNFGRRKELGRHEVALAERLGPNGYDILSSLPWPRLMYLLLKSSSNSVTENDLSTARDNWLKKMTDPGGE